MEIIVRLICKFVLTVFILTRFYCILYTYIFVRLELIEGVIVDTNTILYSLINIP